jgi:hypothetical protein
MSYNLIINSSNVSNTLNNLYVYNFIKGSFEIPEGAEIMLTSFQIPYSWYNISALYGNNKMTINFPYLATTYTMNITFPDGFYTTTDINNYIQLQCLNNGLYLPISPSKLIEKIKYLYVNNINDIDKINFSDTIKFTNNIFKKTNLKCVITHKILDLKYKKNIIALVNENNRFIPIKEIINNDRSLKVSNLNYYSDLDESLVNKIKKPDLRVEIINKKNFEDETYIRMKFELSKFLQIKENSKYMDTIVSIINSDNKNIIKSREKIYNILKKIFSELVLIKNIISETFKSKEKEWSNKEE